MKNWVPTDTSSARPTFSSTASPRPNSWRSGTSGAPRTSPAEADSSSPSRGAHARASGVAKGDKAVCAPRGTANTASTTLNMSTDEVELVFRIISSWTHFPTRGARLARRDEGAHRQYSTEESRRQAGRPARTMSAHVRRGTPPVVTAFDRLPARRSASEPVPRTRSPRTRRQAVRSTGSLPPSG